MSLLLIVYCCVLANLAGIVMAHTDGYPEVIPLGVAAAAINVTVLVIVAARACRRSERKAALRDDK